MRNVWTAGLWLLLGALSSATAAQAETRLLRQPSVSHDHLAFVYAGDLWVSDRNGEHPVQVTSDPANEFAPHFSPDGQWIAYSANYEGNTDVYVVPTAGGQARRLTWHPAADIVTGWSADGKRVLFTSSREVANSRSAQLYEVGLDGGLEHKVMNAVAVEAAWSADGALLAYRPYIKAYAGPSGWRQHRGGDTPPIWIIDLAHKTLEKIPHENASDSVPMWIDGNVAFISDRNDGAANLFLYDRHTRIVRQLTHETLWDVRNAAVNAHTIVYEVGGVLESIDVDTGAIRSIPITLAPQESMARAQWKDASKNITSAALSPTGKRVLVTARGDVYSVPVKEGSTRNLTATSGVRESDAFWSADGQRVAYLSDAGGAQKLLVRAATGLDKPLEYSVGENAYFQLLGWSPDAKRIVFQDNHLGLFALDLTTRLITRIDTSLRRNNFSIAFSQDGQWLAYTIEGANYFTQLRLHSFASGKSVDVADRFVQSDTPAFGGSDYLFFTASIDAGPSRSGLDMSTQEKPLRKGIYSLVLSAKGHSPLAPVSGDEPKDAKQRKAEQEASPHDGSDAADSDNGDDGDEDSDAKDKGSAKHPAASKGDEKVKPTHVDLDGLADRIAPVPVAERNYESLMVGADGALFYTASRQAGSSNEPPDADSGAELYRYSFEDRKEKRLKSGITDVSMSSDRKKLLLTLGQAKLEVANASDKLESKGLDLSNMKVRIDPRAEWAQIFDEAWRMEKQYFYDPKLHGLDWDAVRVRYAALLPYVGRREDLNELLTEMIGELQVGHNRIRGGDVYAAHAPEGGLLGADFVADGPLYRIQKIYRGDRWQPFLEAPLAAPGLGIKEGDAILAIDGQPLDTSMNLYSLLVGKAKHQVALTVSRDGTKKSAHTVVVLPIASEDALRQWEWVEHNRQYVAQKSAGKIAYVYLPDTGDDGYTYFNRMFFAQLDKAAVIVDDRRNSGGQAANYVLEVLGRRYIAGWKDRDGLVFNTPAGAIYGPKVMLIDQDAGSGGDFMPYGFRAMGLGKLMGTRTWGGLIGISANPDLIDGGSVSVPFFRVYSPEGKWIVENEGVAPDVTVELDPLAVNAGQDAQLDAAIAEVLEQLKTVHPAALTDGPAYPASVGH